MNECCITKADQSNPLWLKLTEFYEKRLQSLRVKNDLVPLEKTEQLRGQIKEIKYFLALGQKSKSKLLTEAGEKD